MFGEIQNFDRMQRLVWLPVPVNRTTGRVNDRTIAELLVGSCISRQIADRATSRRKSYVGACSVTMRFYEMWHDQSLEGRISCTTKSMIFDNRSFMTGGTAMND